MRPAIYQTNARVRQAIRIFRAVPSVVAKTEIRDALNMRQRIRLMRLTREELERIEAHTRATYMN
jgi:hypothetical protein